MPASRSIERDRTLTTICRRTPIDGPKSRSGARQMDAEGRALVSRSLHGDPSTLALDERARDGEAKTDPRRAGRSRSVAAVEALKEPRKVVGRDTRPAVGDRDDRLVAARRHDHRHESPRG